MKLRSIDSIRGIAILMVILVHTAQKIHGSDAMTRILTKYGQMGVQLFFVASAYTLCLSAVRREDESFPLAKFAIRRYFRIAPAYYLGILLYFALSLISSSFNYGQSDASTNYSLMNIASNLTFIHGFFPSANNSIVPGGWSIGTEMAFYALFPFLFAMANKFMTNSRANIVVFVAAAVLLSQGMVWLAGLLGFNIANNTFIYYNLITQLPVFVIGIAYFFSKRYSQFDWSSRVDILCFTVLTLLALALWLSGIKYFFSIIPLVSAFSFVFLMEIFFKIESLNFNMLVRVGQVSYSMYLLHFVFANIITGICASKFGLSGNLWLLVFYAFSVAFTFFSSLIVEKYIEVPGIEFGKKLISKFGTLATERASNTRRG